MVCSLSFFALLLLIKYRVGGPIGENNFKFFLQFVGYTALFCVNVLVVMAKYIHQQRGTQV